MLSRSFGQVAYVLRDRSPLGIAAPLDLHFLGTPQAFVLSQDQTLHTITIKAALPEAFLPEGSSAPNIEARFVTEFCGQIEPGSRMPERVAPIQNPNSKNPKCPLRSTALSAANPFGCPEPIVTAYL